MRKRMNWLAGRFRYYRWMLWYRLPSRPWMPEPWEMEAEYRPRHTGDLKAGWAERIGRRGVWRRLWVITPEDGGRYVGYWAWESPRDWEHIDGFWVPECDLAGVGR